MDDQLLLSSHELVVHEIVDPEEKCDEVIEGLVPTLLGDVDVEDFI